MARITVTHRFGDSFDVRIRGYKLISDEPRTVGGDDEGPTPTELMVAGLAACAAEEGVKHLSDEGLPYEGLEVMADFTWDIETSRVDAVRLSVTVPAGLGTHEVHFLEMAMLACPARKMLTEPPTLKYSFAEQPASTVV